MPSPIQILTQAILAIVLKLNKPVLIEEGYQEDYEYGEEIHYENRHTDPNKIASIIAESYDYGLNREGALEYALESIKGIRFGWQGEGICDSQLWLMSQEAIDKEEENQRKQAEKEAVKSVLAQYDYDLDKLRDACEKADADLQHELNREDWMCDCYPTPQGFADAQDIRNERIASASQVQADTLRAYQAMDMASNLRNRY